MKNPKDNPYAQITQRYPAEGRKFVFIDPLQDFQSLASDYQNAAELLYESFTGAPYDDKIIKPYLLLTRHAFELELKGMILGQERARKKLSGDILSWQETDELVECLRVNYRHNLHKLYNRVVTGIDDSFLNAPTPPLNLNKMIGFLHAIDKSGQTFRYDRSPQLKEPVNLNFEAFHNDLREAHSTLIGMNDYFENVADELIE